LQPARKEPYLIRGRSVTPDIIRSTTQYKVNLIRRST